MNNVLMRRPNKVREKLARGQVAVGTAIYSHSPAMVAAAGYAGIDFVRIDDRALLAPRRFPRKHDQRSDYSRRRSHRSR